MSENILILNGPNLNLLGTREPHIYGTSTLGDIEQACAARAQEIGFDIDFRQSNSESDLITFIQQAAKTSSGIIINPAAYSHTSIAIADAIEAVGLPVIEVHVSNIFAREAFRHHSYISPVATGIVCGFGTNGYILALNALRELI